MSDQDSSDGKRRRLEGVIPEILKRAMEIGVEKATDTVHGAPDSIKQFVNDLKVPKEIAAYLFSQIDDTKTGIFRVVGKEIREFLTQTNLSGEMQKMLTTVQFEVNTTIRFTPNSRAAGAAEKSARGDADDREAADADKKDDGDRLPKPEVKTDVYVKREDRRDRRHRSRGE